MNGLIPWNKIGKRWTGSIQRQVDNRKFSRQEIGSFCSSLLLPCGLKHVCLHCSDSYCLLFSRLYLQNHSVQVTTTMSLWIILNGSWCSFQAMMLGALLTFWVWNQVSWSSKLSWLNFRPGINIICMSRRWQIRSQPGSSFSSSDKHSNWMTKLSFKVSWAQRWASQGHMVMSLIWFSEEQLES